MNIKVVQCPQCGDPMPGNMLIGSPNCVWCHADHLNWGHYANANGGRYAHVPQDKLLGQWCKLSDGSECIIRGFAEPLMERRDSNIPSFTIIVEFTPPRAKRGHPGEFETQARMHVDRIVEMEPRIKPLRKAKGIYFSLRSQKPDVSHIALTPDPVKPATKPKQKSSMKWWERVPE